MKAFSSRSDRRKRRACIALVVLAVAAALGLLLDRGIVRFNYPPETVRGVDVSHYQGEIDWPAIAKQDIEFAYVKATEGSGSRDERFDANWSGARASGLRTGAYHFFSYDSSGLDQAENFIATVPAESDALPPVIDVEAYGGYDARPASRADVLPQLRAMVEALQKHYGKPPVIYTTSRFYRLYISGEFQDCGVWIRDVFHRPRLPDGRRWMFWQYSSRGRLNGTHGVEPYIDLNVYFGTTEQLVSGVMP